MRDLKNWAIEVFCFPVTTMLKTKPIPRIFKKTSCCSLSVSIKERKVYQVRKLKSKIEEKPESGGVLLNQNEFNKNAVETCLRYFIIPTTTAYALTASLLRVCTFGINFDFIAM